ncbi:hypothetical protein ACLKA6_004388 [Drosophila palustris]
MATISKGSAARPTTTEGAAYVEVPLENATPKEQKSSRHKKCHIKKLLSEAALFFALLLIVGAIILHTRQKSHFGRMNIGRGTKLKQQQKENVTDIILPLEVVTAPAVAALSTELVNEDCLECIAATITGNKPGMCGKSPCGIYRIYRPYWQDAARTVQAAGVEDYESCVLNSDCAAAIVRGYMKTYPVDCDGDGVIGCKDHIMLHLLGPTGCVTNPLKAIFQTRMDECLRVKAFE